MAQKNNEVTMHKCILYEQAKKVKESINLISQKDSLSNCDTQAIRMLLEVYETLSNPIQENQKLFLAIHKNGHCEASQ